MAAAAHHALQRLLSRPCAILLRSGAGVRRRLSSSALPFSAISVGAVPAAARRVLSSPAGGVGRRRFSDGIGVRAAQVNDPGAIDSPLMQSMEKKIKEQLSAESVVVKDAYGDGRHVSIDVVASAFEGQTAVNRQRMVYKAIWEELQSTVHAVDQMTTRTPSEASAGGGR
ncbi:bolA-like family protein [Wolffia australiana]